jgi:hypothetical protein
MFRRYFQTNDEDEQEGSSGDEDAEQTEQTPPPEEVWAHVSFFSCTWLLLSLSVSAFSHPDASACVLPGILQLLFHECFFA